MRVVVLGVGNPLYSDDGFGIDAVAAFKASDACGPGIEAVDAGTEGLALLGYIEEATHLVILDAVEGAESPGTVVEYTADQIASGVGLKLSQHQVGVEEVLGLAVWRGRLPKRSVLLGVVAQTLDFGIGLSDPVRLAMPAVLARLGALLAEWGVDRRAAVGPR